MKDVEVIVREGDEIPANHPVVKGREHFFEQILARALPVIGGRRGRAG